MSPSLVLCLAALCADPVATSREALEAPVIGYAVRDISDVKTLFKGTGVRPPSGKGVIVSGVAPHSPAHKAGFRVGDIIRQVNGEVVSESPAALPETLGLKSGAAMEIMVVPCVVSASGRPTWRKSETRTLKVSTRGDIGVAAMIVRTDVVTGEKWIYHADAPFHVDVSNDAMLMYQLDDNDKPRNLRMKIGYLGEKWLFIESVSFRMGERLLKIEVPFSEINREVGKGAVTEWVAIPINASGASVLRAVSEPGRCILRLSGETRQVDREIDDETRMMWHQTMDAYQWLGGTVTSGK